MSVLKKVRTTVFNKKKLVGALSRRGFFDLLSDKQFIKLQFKTIFGYSLDLNNPKTFNEKLQWIKLKDRKPIYSTMVDKAEVKDYVAEKIGEQYIIKTLGIWDKFEDIDFDLLPERFVMKCTHDSGGLVICKEKTTLDFEKTQRKIEKCIKTNYYKQGREWPYKNVKPRIIAEEYMEDTEVGELRDYKFFCFNGKVKCFKIDFDRFIEHRANYFSKNKELLPFGEVVCPPDYNRKLDMPENLDEMIELAEKLAEKIPFVRIDFYSCNHKIYFGEMTFFPASGFGKFIPNKWDRELGDWISL